MSDLTATPLICQVCSEPLVSTSGFWLCPNGARDDHPQRRLPLIGRDRWHADHVARALANGIALDGVGAVAEIPYGNTFDVDRGDGIVLRVTVELLPRGSS